MTLFRYFFIVVLIIAGTAYAQAASAATKVYSFDVFREGSKIGTHVVTVTEEGNRTTAKVAIDLEVKIAFITLYAYEHRATEIRENGKLISLSSKTDNDGSISWTEAIRDGDVILSKSNKGEFTLPDQVIPTTYWSLQTIKQSEFIDSQTGQLWTLQAEDMGIENVPTQSGDTKASHYRLSGSQELDVWYTDTGEWVKLAFDFKDSKFEYKPQISPDS